MTHKQCPGFPDELTVREAKVAPQVRVALIAHCNVGNRPVRIERGMRKPSPYDILVQRLCVPTPADT